MTAPLWPFDEYVALSAMAVTPRTMPPDVEQIFYLADDLRRGVAARTKRGSAAPFGRASALMAVHALALWISRLPPAQRAAVLERLR